MQSKSSATTAIASSIIATKVWHKNKDILKALHYIFWQE
jgi:hypothetical protein